MWSLASPLQRLQQLDPIGAIRKPVINLPVSSPAVRTLLGSKV